MSLQIRSIGVYSHDGELRSIDFELNALNIVTGASQTGKSALLDIVDYCWGRDECTVAEGDIRKSVTWFAVLFDSAGEGVLLARRNPGPSSSKGSDDIYFERGVDVLPPTHDRFKKNITFEGLKSALSTVLGIAENVNIPEAGSTRKPLEASARHAILFCLQQQDEIANRRLLFHRQGEQFFPAAIRDSLPYFLGAVDERHYLALKRHGETKTRLRKLEREFADIQSLTSDATNTAQSLLGEAIRSGLIDTQQVVSSDAQTVRALLSAASAPRSFSLAEIDNPEADLTALEERRRSVRGSLTEVRDEIGELRRIEQEANEFEAEANEQRVRLKSIGLISHKHEASQTCPLCASHLENPVPTVEEIQRSLEGIEMQLGSVRRDTPRLQERLSALEARRASLEDDLREVQRQITDRVQENERLRIEQNIFTEQARVSGRIAYYLDNVRETVDNSNLKRNIERLQAELAELDRIIEEGSSETRLETAFGLVNRELSRLAETLELEHSENPLRLDKRLLTVVADTDDGPLALPQMGSGANWVGYHIVAHLALHRVFRRKSRPVPGFLILDQPSQAHYPPERDEGGRVDGLEDEDQAAVERLFKLFWEYCGEGVEKTQLIVADHVELLDDWFRASISQRWREGIKLIPNAWERR